MENESRKKSPGRTPVPVEMKLTEQIRINATREEKVILEGAAASMGLSLSAFFRYAALTMAQQKTPQQGHIQCRSCGGREFVFKGE